MDYEKIHGHDRAAVNTILWHFHNYGQVNEDGEHAHGSSTEPGYSHCTSPPSNPWVVFHVGSKHKITSEYARGHGLKYETQWFKFTKKLGNGWDMESEIKVNPEDVPNKFKHSSNEELFLEENIKKSINFSFIVQIWKGQTVIRDTPSRILWRLLIETPDGKDPITSFALTSNPIENNEVSASKIPCPDAQALSRGEPNENRDYLDPEKGSFWNDTKDTFSALKKLDSGTVIFYIKNGFWKFLVRGRRLKGIYTLKQQAKSNMWTWKKDVGPGGKIE